MMGVSGLTLVSGRLRIALNAKVRSAWLPIPIELFVFLKPEVERMLHDRTLGDEPQESLALP